MGVRRVEHRPRGLEIGVAAFPGFGILGEAWRALEAEAERGGGAVPFFRSWAWLGCLAEERFPDPVLLRATEGGHTVGLALFNRRGRVLHLGESGDPGLDAPYVEHNGPLVLPAAGEGAEAALLRGAWEVRGVSGLRLSGTGPALFAAAGGVEGRRLEVAAPFIDLDAIRAARGTVLGSLSANSRAQLRRSMRHFEARGPLRLARPGSAAEAGAWLEEMIALHTGRWQEKGKPGAFATPFLRRFHAALIARAAEQEALDLLRLEAGGEVLGHLYNFRSGGTVFAYQSGFRQFSGEAAARPGLVAHLLAAEQALTEGLARYDFLAGDSRYKRSLANASTTLVWGERVRPFSLGAAAGWLRRLRG